jgi:hypothetical protein
VEIFLGNQPLWSQRRKWDDDVKMDVRKIGCKYVNWIEQA